MMAKKPKEKTFKDRYGHVVRVGDTLSANGSNAFAFVSRIEAGFVELIVVDSFTTRLSRKEMRNTVGWWKSKAPTHFGPAKRKAKP